MPRNLENRRNYQRNYYRRRLAEDPAFKAVHLARVKKTNDKVRREIRVLIAEFRAKGCSKCPEIVAICLSAHHREPSAKNFNLGNAVSTLKSASRVIEELAKCVCLCHNCHAKVHAGLIEL